MTGVGRPWVVFLVWVLCVPWLMFATVVPVLTVGALGVLLVVQVRARWRGETPAGTLDSLIILYLALATISTIFSPVPLLAIRKLAVLTLGTHLYFFVRDYLHPAGVNKLYHLNHTLTLLALLISLTAPFTMLWPARQFIPLGKIAEVFPHLTGTFSIHHNEIAGLLLLLLPLVIVTLQQGLTRHWRWLAGFTLLLMLFVLATTQSRTAWLTILLSFAIWWAWGRWTRRATGVLLGLLVVLGAGLVLTDLTWTGLMDALLQIDVSSKQGNADPASWQTRLEIWQTSLFVLRDYPVVGVGLGGFSSVTRLNYPLALVSLSNDFGHAHNLLLQTGATMGWAGMFVLLCLGGVALWGMGSGRGPSPIPASLTTPFAISLINYLIFNQVDFIGPAQRTGLPIWLILAVCASHKPLPRCTKALPYLSLAIVTVLWLSPLRPANLANLKLDTAQITNQPPDPHWPVTDAQRRGLTAYLQGDIPTAQTHWQNTQHLIPFLETRGRLAVVEGDYKRAIDWYNTALTFDDTVATLYFWRGRAFFNQGNAPQALTNYEQAYQLGQAQLSRSWQANILQSWGELHMSQQEWEEAVYVLNQGSQLAPNNPFLHHLLGDALLATGDHEGAEKAYEKVP